MVDDKPEQPGPTRPGSVQEHISLVLGETVEVVLQRPGPRAGITPEPGTLLGRYPITGHLGAGGMGEVLQVRDEDLGREMAAKILLDPADRSSTLKFALEAQITGQLEHPGIVPVHELGLDPDGRIYFTMKRVEGETLKSLLQTGPGSLMQLLSIFMKVCDAVAFAHSREVVHRDLKPANIMVGAFGEVQVMDWGLAKVAGWVSPAREGVVMGTPSYMPPEQARGEVGELDHRADIYALGAILYQILTRDPPYVGMNAAEILAQVLAVDPPPPSQRAPGLKVPWELEAVVLKAMSRDRDDRYPDVADMQHDIEAFLEGRTLAAARYTTRQLVTKWLQRHRALAAGAAAVILVAGIVAGGFSWRKRQHRLTATSQAMQALSRARESKSLSACWEAVRAADRALLLAPEDEELILARRQAAEGLGEAALAARDYAMAREVFDGLVDYGAARKDVDRLLARIDESQNRELRRREGRLETMVADIGAGLSRPGRGRSTATLTDYIFEAVAYRDPQTAEILGKVLDGLAALAPERGKAAPWTQAEKDLAEFCCEVLGRTGLAESVPPLARWLEALGRRGELRLIVWAGHALCNVHQATALEPLASARDRLGNNSTAWIRISKRMSQVPDMPGDEPATAMQFHARGVLRYEQGDLVRAISDYDRAIELDPRCTAAYHDRGNVRMVRGDPAGAISDYDRAIELDPQNAGVYSNRALAREAKGDLAGAISDYGLAIKLDPEDVGAYLNRGAAREEMGDYAGAISDLSRAIELDPESAMAHNNRGLARKGAGDLEGAVSDYDRAIELDPRCVFAYCNRGVVRRDKGDLPGAISDYDRAIRIDPRYAVAYYSRGRVYEAKGDAARAFLDYDQAIKLDPEYAEAHVHRGKARAAKGDLAGAIADYDRAIELDPELSPAYFNRANARSDKGDHAGAISDFDRVLQLDPGNTRAYIRRGRTREVSGDLAGAASDYGQAIRLDKGLWQVCVIRAVVLGKLGRRKEAIESLRRAHAVAPAAHKPAVWKMIESLQKKQ